MFRLDTVNFGALKDYKGITCFHFEVIFCEKDVL